MRFYIDLIYGVEPVVYQKLTEFPGKIVILDEKTAIFKAKKDLSTLALCINRSKVESWGVRDAIT